MFHPHWRQYALERLSDPFDLIVIGGGITGCGVLMDAAQRGLRALLVEKDDISSGTSSRSSKLVHGGLRYLKEMQFRVTRQASVERDRMVVLNPALVEPMSFVYPANHGDELPSWKVDLGLWMYDRLTNRPQKHSHLTVGEVDHMLPGLATDRLEQAYAYSDARTDDSRLTFAVAATGFAYGGLVLTRAEVVELIEGPGGRIAGVRFTDLESGESQEARAHVVVNATGVWVDELRDRGGLEGRKLKPSRGVHIVVPKPRLPVEAAAMVPSPDDGRPIFLIPHPEGVLVGTTDIFHEGSLDDPRASRGEVDYLLRALQSHFPSHDLVDSDVRGAFAGLRPILHSHSDDPSAVSREEELWEENGLLSIAGGKLTTWRPMAEEVVDAAIELLPEERASRVGPCHTKGTPLVGVAPLDLAERLSSIHGLHPDVAAAMARRLRAVAIWAPSRARDSDELRPLGDGVDLTAAEVRAHITFGAVLHLDDLLLRRVRIGVWDPERARELLPQLQPLFEDESGWDHRRWSEEVDRYRTAAEGWSPSGVID